MPKLIIKNEQIGIEPNEIYNIKPGMTPVDVLMVYLPEGIDPESTKIYLNTTEINVLDEDLMTKPISNNQIITVVKEVKGIETAVLVASLLISVAVYASMPDIPGDAGVSQSSPNNSHTAQTNIARAYQALPMIFGNVISYPDLIGEAIVEYINNVKTITQYLCVGIDSLSISDVLIGSTPFENYEDAEYAIYQPQGVDGDTNIINYDTVTKLDDINGQELLGQNQKLTDANYECTESGTDQTTYVSGFFTFKTSGVDAQSLYDDYNDFTGLNFEIDLEYEYAYNVDTINYDFASATGSGEITNITVSGGVYTVEVSNFNGRYSVATTNKYQGPFNVTTKKEPIIGPFNLQRTCTKFQSNIIFPNGLKGECDITITFQLLDGKNGNPIAGPGVNPVVVISRSDDTTEFRAYTIYTDLNEGWYQVTYERTNDSNDDASNPDQAYIESAYIVENHNESVSFPAYTLPNVTVLKTVVPAGTNTTTSENTNKINVNATSELITYENGSINYGARASRKMADAVLHLHVIHYGLDPDLLDLDGLYEIQNRLDAIDERLATFDFTFDDLDVGYEDQIDSILQVARCYKWLDGNVYRFARDEKREFESTVITRRDIANESDREYSYSYSPNLGSYDSVKLEYIDKSTNNKAYIYRKLDSNSDVVDGVGVNPISIELAGCKESYNAINRAELEMRKLMYQREKLSDTLLPLGMFLDKGDMFLYAEQYNKSDNLFDGEILAVSGTVATTSEQVFFDGVSSYVVHYTDENGDSLGPFSISEVAGNANQFNCSSLSDVYVRDSKLGYLVQTGSRYIISTVEELEQSRWTLVEKEPSGRNVQVTAVNYDERIYEYDEE